MQDKISQLEAFHFLYIEVFNEMSKYSTENRSFFFVENTILVKAQFAVEKWLWQKCFFWLLFRTMWLLLPNSSFKILLKRLVFWDNYRNLMKKDTY